MVLSFLINVITKWLAGLSDVIDHYIAINFTGLSDLIDLMNKICHDHN